MKVSKIYLKDIRCFEEITIDLSTHIGAYDWSLILGNNGVGKTTILRTLAMGLCDKTGAAGLLQDTYGNMIRFGKEEATIHIELVHESVTYSVTTKINKSSKDIEVLTQERTANFPWDNLFVCGYGANRSIRGSDNYDNYSIADALYTLFDYKADLQNPELMLRRRATSEEELAETCKWLDEMLMLEKGSTKLDNRGLVIKGIMSDEVTFGSLPDGYAATITLVSDMLGWALLAEKQTEKNNLNGIVIIDELEQHLHPSWQIQIVRLLHSVFKNIQFICTTHSPLCAIGSANLENAEQTCSLVSLYQDGNEIKVQDRIAPPKDKRADQVLTSHLFGLQTTRSDSFMDDVETYTSLLQKENRTEADNEALSDLKEKLDFVQSKQETALQSTEHKIFNSTLDSILFQQLTSPISETEKDTTKRKIEQKYFDILDFGDGDDKD
ncbi:MAG: AAA family ATPase [Planctomycetes bacterium]|nr:AAA family ATPase [Planctomycetota bacterium]